MNIFRKIIKKINIVVDRLETKVRIEKWKKKKNKEKVIFIQSPDHGNLGDHLISMGIRELISKKYPNKDVVEFSGPEYDKFKNDIKEIINNKDIIILVGGGNFGNLYMIEEERRRDVIDKCVNNKIIVMPVTITYTDDSTGRKELEIMKEICNRHKDLTIFCREEKSYKTALENFNNNIILSPDSANALEDFFINKWCIKRDGVLFCLRNDKEKVRDQKNIEKIKKILDKKDIKYKVTDTVVPKRVTKKTRKKELEKLVKQMLSSKLLVTDRLHGMILGVITNTPTIAFKSLDHKITESYKWYKEYEYINYLENDENIEEIIDKMLNLNLKKDDYTAKVFLEEKFMGI